MIHLLQSGVVQKIVSSNARLFDGMVGRRDNAFR